MWNKPLPGSDAVGTGSIKPTPIPPELDGLYKTFFSAALATSRPLHRLLDVLVAAWEPLTEEELAAASGLDAEDNLPEASQSLSAYLRARRRSRRMRNIFLYPQSLVDWLTHPDRRQSFIGRPQTRP